MKTGLTLCLLFVSILLNAQDNIQWRGVDRTGIFKEEGLLKKWPADGPALKWNYSGLGEGHSSVAINDNKIYLTGLKGDKGILYVLDLNGKLLQQKEYGLEWSESYPGPRGTATIDQGKIYLISGMGDIYCFNQKTLDVIWTKNVLKEYDAPNIKWGINESPLIIGDKVIVTPGGTTNNLMALDKNTGELIWSCAGEGEQSAYCSPLYIGDQDVPQIVTITAGHIIGVDVKTGKKLWSHEKVNRYSIHPNSPVYNNNMLLCFSGYGSGAVMLKLVNGGKNVEKVWDSEVMDNKMGGIVKVGDYAYGSGDKNRFWFCADWKTGEIKFKESGLAMGNIIANDGMLYCYTDRGEMLLVNATPDKFDIVSRFSISLGTAQHWAHPVIYKGIMYVRHGDALLAYSVK